MLPCGASDRRLAAACQWPMADCLTGHHVACALLGDFEPLPGATFLAIAAAAVFRIAKERPERIVRLHLSLVQMLDDDRLVDLLPGTNPSMRIEICEGRRGTRMAGAVQRTVHSAEEVLQHAHAALHVQARSRHVQATIGQLLVESHGRFAGGRMARGCFTVADLSGLELFRPAGTPPAGGASDDNSALRALLACVDTLAESQRSLAGRQGRPAVSAGMAAHLPWRASKLTRLLRDQLGGAPCASCAASASLTLVCSLPGAGADAHVASPATRSMLTLVDRAAVASAFLAARSGDGGGAGAEVGATEEASAAAKAERARSLRRLREAVTRQEELLRCVGRVAPEAVGRAKASFSTRSASIPLLPSSCVTHTHTLTLRSPCAQALQVSDALCLSLAPSAARNEGLGEAEMETQGDHQRAPSPPPPLALLAALEEEEWEAMVAEASLLYGEQARVPPLSTASTLTSPASSAVSRLRGPGPPASSTSKQAALERDAFDAAARRLKRSTELLWLRTVNESGEAAHAAGQVRVSDVQRELAELIAEAPPRRAACEAHGRRIASFISEVADRVPSVEKQQALRLCLAVHALHLRAERRGLHAMLVRCAARGALEQWGRGSVHETEVQQLLQVSLRLADELLAALEAAATAALDVVDAIPCIRPPTVLDRAPTANFAAPLPAGPKQMPTMPSLGAMARALEGHCVDARPLLQQVTQSLREARRQRLSLRQLHEALASEKQHELVPR